MVRFTMEKNKILSISHASTIIPDMIVQICPFTCGEACERTWSNSVISHKIICDCSCHTKKDDAADGFKRPDSAAFSQLSQEVTKESDSNILNEDKNKGFDSTVNNTERVAKAPASRITCSEKRV
jgi:hypothetical protein